MAWAPDYVTSTDFNNYVGSTSLDSVVVATAITSASRLVDEWTGRQFGVVAEAEARTYTARPDYRRGQWVVDVDDVATTDGLLIDITDYPGVVSVTWEPANAVLQGKVWTRFYVDTDSAVQPTGAPNEVVVTALWGWPSVPTPVKQATLLQANRLATRRKSPHGIAGSPEMGTELRFLARLDPDAQMVLAGYRRRRAVG